MARNKRPEDTLPPYLYYNEIEANKYTSNSHIIDVQTRLSERALELLALPQDNPAVILDIGCGSGLSGEVLTENDHHWVGIDISKSMLDIAVKREVEGELVYGDIGCPLPFRSGTFDGAISISAIQWLCHSDSSAQHPIRRIRKFFSSLFACMANGSRAVLQFYPDGVDQLDILQTEALRAGFNGGLVVDYPNSTKAKKYFLVLNVGSFRQMPTPITHGEAIRSDTIIQGTRSRQEMHQERRGNASKNSIAWIKKKKERARIQDRQTANDSHYTGRKRRPKF